MGNVVRMDLKLPSSCWYMFWPSWPAHISKLCSYKNQGCVSIYELTNLKLMPYLLYTLYSIGALITLEPKIVLTQG